jgi:hypothetical protein
MRRTKGAFVPVMSLAAVRRRARRWATLAGAALVSPFVVLVAAAAGWLPSELAIVLAMIVVPAVLLILSETCEERPPLRSNGARLTARTLTGERTVDLSVISTVRLLTYFSRSGISERVLLVRDVNGVRLGLKSAAGRAALRRALERSRAAATAPHPQPHVSRAALVYLGMVTGRTSLVLHTVLSWLVMVNGICGYIVMVLALADRVPK